VTQTDGRTRRWTQVATECILLWLCERRPTPAP